MQPLTPVIAGVLSCVSAAIAATAAVTLLVPATPLSTIWSIKPAEYAELLALGPLVGVGFVALAVVAVTAAWGAFLRRRWAWWLIVVALAVNALSDAVRLVRGDVLEGAMGVVIAGAILWWMMRPAVRQAFSARPPVAR